MAVKLLSEDGESITFQNDIGKVVKVAKRGINPDTEQRLRDSVAGVKPNSFPAMSGGLSGKDDQLRVFGTGMPDAVAAPVAPPMGTKISLSPSDLNPALLADKFVPTEQVRNEQGFLTRQPVSAPQVSGNTPVASLDRPRNDFQLTQGVGLGGGSRLGVIDREIQKNEKVQIAKANDLLANQRKELVLQEERLNEVASKERELAVAESAYHDETSKQAELRQVEMKAKEDQRQQAVKGETDKYKRMQSDVAQLKVDPDNFWSSKDTGAKIRFVTAGALMGFAGGLRGDPMAGINMLQSFIDRDMEAQRQNIATKKEQASSQANLIQMTRAEFGDERQADLAANALAWEAVEGTLRGFAAKAKDVEAQQRAVELLNQASDKSMAAHGQFVQYTGDMAAANLATRANIAGQRDQNDATITAARIEAMGKIAKEGGGKQLSEQTIEKMGDLQAGLDDLTGLETDFYANTDASSIITQGKIPFTKSRDYENRRRLAVTQLISRLTGAGVSETEAERISGLIPGAGTLDADAKTQFAALRREIETKVNNRTAAYKGSGYNTEGIEQINPNVSGAVPLR